MNQRKQFEVCFLCKVRPGITKGMCGPCAAKWYTKPTLTPLPRKWDV